MRTVDSTHRWNYSIMECAACGCATTSEIALMPCMKAAPPPPRVQQPKAPDLLTLSMDAESKKL